MLFDSAFGKGERPRLDETGGFSEGPNPKKMLHDKNALENSVCKYEVEEVISGSNR